MKILKSLRVINWHYICDETIDFEMINFLTGKTGVGKSTLIDCLQLVIQGDTKGAYFNKAAGNGGDRTLEGYVRGEIGFDGEKSTYLRNEEFSTHIVIEIYDDLNKKSFIFGFAMDIDEDGEDEKYFYWADAKIEDIQYIKNGYELKTTELKALLKEMQSESKIFQTQKAYRDALRTKLGNINETFFSLFRKATAFTPITDIQGFITKFICDTENSVNIENMQANIRQYDRMRAECESVERMVASLEEIKDLYEKFKKIDNELELKKFISAKSLCGVKADEININHNDQKRIQREIDDENKKLDILVNEENQLELELADARSILHSLEAFKIEEEKTQEIDRVLQENISHKEYYDRIAKSLNNRMYKWSVAIDQYNKYPLESYGQIELDITRLIETLRARMFNIDIEEYLDEISHIKSELTRKKRELSNSLSIKQKEMDVETKIKATLDKGSRNYHSGLLMTKDRIEEALNKEFNRNIEVQIFCEVIDIKGDQWRNAIEGYLGNRRFNLIVDPKYYDAALHTYNEFTKVNGFYGFGLVDIEGVINDSPKTLDNSLFDEIESDNEYALIYSKTILGRVIKCESLSDLKKYRISITKDCLLYKSRVSSRMNPAHYKYPYVGKKSIIEQKKANKTRLNILSKEINDLKLRIEPLEPFESLPYLQENDIDDFNDAKIRKRKHGEGVSRITVLKDELKSIDLSAVDNQKKKIQSLEDLYKKKIEERISCDSAITTKINEHKELIESEPQLQLELIDFNNQLLRRFSDDNKRRILTEK